MKKEIIQTFQRKIFALNKNDLTYEARKEYLENKMEEKLDSVDSFVKGKNKRKRKFENVDEKIAEFLDFRKVKMVIEFNNHEAVSIKSIAVKKRNNIKVTTRFMPGKLLMFAKLSLKSFIYDMIETFCFPDENVKEISKKYGIERVEICHVLTDTDSTSLKFIFIFDLNSEIPENKYRDIIFEIIISSQIYKRFDSSHEFWDIFETRKVQKRKKLGYYEIENIDDPCILTLAANPKEYLVLFEDKNINKKHKCIKKGSSGMGFKNFAQRVGSLVNFDTLEKPPADKKQMPRRSVIGGEMVKNKFSQLNDKRFCFLHGVVSLPFNHPILSKINHFKQKKGQKIEKYFWEEKKHLFHLEKETLKKPP